MSAAAMSRSTERIAATSSARCASSSGSRIEAASSSLRSSRSARSARPFSLEPRDPDATYHVSLGVRLDETVGLERAQHPAQLPRIHPEARAQHDDLGALGPDLPQQPGDGRADGHGRRKWSSSAPTRCVTERLKRRTCAICAVGVDIL